VDVERTLTEAEWLACTDPVVLTEHGDMDFDLRMTRCGLYVVAYCREIKRRADELYQEWHDSWWHWSGSTVRGYETAARLTEALDLVEPLLDASVSWQSWEETGAPVRGEGRRLAREANAQAYAFWNQILHTIPNNPEDEGLYWDLRGPGITRWRDLYFASSELLEQLAGSHHWALMDLALNHDTVSRLCSELSWEQRISWLRDLFPYRQSLAADPSWLSWSNGTVPQLVREIRNERQYELMPILADALEDAGCHNADILGHCRGPGLHVRGCWVVDLLLGKE
jgi:hypothetical protein